MTTYATVIHWGAFTVSVTYFNVDITFAGIELDFVILMNISV